MVNDLVLANYEDAEWFLQEKCPRKTYKEELLSGDIRGELQEPAGEDCVPCIFTH